MRFKDVTCLVAPPPARITPPRGRGGGGWEKISLGEDMDVKEKCWLMGDD